VLSRGVTCKMDLKGWAYKEAGSMTIYGMLSAVFKGQS
jgi:hypothetical protein